MTTSTRVYMPVCQVDSWVFRSENWRKMIVYEHEVSSQASLVVHITFVHNQKNLIGKKVVCVQICSAGPSELGHTLHVCAHTTFNCLFIIFGQIGVLHSDVNEHTKSPSVLFPTVWAFLR